jgi:GcvH upstream region-like protein
MLDFFRRHQRYFFMVITVVIVISFSFFGTYSSMSNNSFREQIAFTAVDGTDITRRELDEMALFLGTDAEDKVQFGGIWGPNFLNDGVIKKNFLETGLASMLMAAYPEEVKSDLVSRYEKEKRYSLYTNPQARFIGTEAVWNYFVPEMTSYYHAVRLAGDPTTPEAIQARVALFLMEKQIPAPLLRQVLRYQEKQYSWLTPDRNLDYTDLSLFGYHTIEDWFGPRFMRLASEFIINTALIAEQKGYEVTKAEALADLMRNAEISYQQNIRNPNLGVTSSREYFNEQLRRLGMDQNQAAKLWRQVLLSRRLFQDMGSSVFVDPYTFQKLDAYALESAEGELYRLPKELRIGTFYSMQKLEAYLEAVAKQTEDEKQKLLLPTAFLSLAEISKKYPELVQKRYLLEVSHIDKKDLEANVGVKESWSWEVTDNGWESLRKQFPELGKAKASTADERFAVLDALDDKTRARVDAFARAAIVDSHPEWITQALEEAVPSKMVIGLHEKGGKIPFAGLENGKALMQLLDIAPLASEDSATHQKAAQEAAKKLMQYTANKNTYYRILVIDRATQPEVLTFAEADQESVLDKLLDAQLEAYYLKIREANPKDFQVGDQNWKPFEDVKAIVADRYFAKVLKAIQTSYATAVGQDAAPKEMIGDFAATLRLYPYMREVKEKLQKDPSKIGEWTKEASATPAEKNVLPASVKLADQWKLERSPYQTTRSSADHFLDKNELFALSNGEWTKINTPANGDLNFFFLKEKGNVSDMKTISTGVSKARQMLSNDAQQKLMKNLLAEIKEKQAISLDYLNQVIEREPIDSSDDFSAN